MTTLPLSPWMYLHLVSGQKIHIITPIPFEVGEEFQFERSFIGTESIFIKKKVTAVQRVFFAIDQEQNFIVMIDKKVLNEAEKEIFAKNNGNTCTESLLLAMLTKMEEHCFYKQALEVNLVHFTNFRYQSLTF